jgi:hypothetical protein
MYSRGSDSEQHGHSFTSISHSIHTVKKFTLYCTQGDVGSESDCCIECGVPTVAINFHTVMDPITLLLLFNVTVWLYWSIK